MRRYRASRDTPAANSQNNCRLSDLFSKGMRGNFKLAELVSNSAGGAREPAAQLLAQNHGSNVRRRVSRKRVRPGDDDPVFHRSLHPRGLRPASLRASLQFLRLPKECPRDAATSQQLAKGYHTASYLQRALRA